MKKFIIITVVIVGLVVAYWLVSPLFITKKVSEKIEDIAPASQTLKQGAFIGLEGHHAQGTALLLKIGDKYYVRLDDDFKVTNGPDLFVHFGKDGQYAAAARLDSLKGNEGGQNYEVPAGINPLDYNEVWIWCRAFSVAFGKAVLQ